MSKILYTEKDIPRWLPEEVRRSAINRLKYLENLRLNPKITGDESSLKFQNNLDEKTSEAVNFVYRLAVDERMKPVWQKLFKINKDRTSRLLQDLEFHRSFSCQPNQPQFINVFDYRPKIAILKSTIKKCENLLSFVSDSHTFYTTEFDFEEYDRSELIGEREHDEFVGNLATYLNRLKKLLAYHEANGERFEAKSYLMNPASRKKSIDNAEAILWAKKVKTLILRFYKKPLNKEVGTIISVLFDDDHLYDEDYIAKITKSVKNALKKSEDSI